MKYFETALRFVVVIVSANMFVAIAPPEPVLTLFALVVGLVVGITAADSLFLPQVSDYLALFRRLG